MILLQWYAIFVELVAIGTLIALVIPSTNVPLAVVEGPL